MHPKGTIAVEEAVISPDTAWLLDECQRILTPGDAGRPAIEAHKTRLMDIHGSRLDAMDAEGVEFMLLSLTSPGCQGIHDQQLAEKSATDFNNWLAGEIAKNPCRFGGLAALSMHDPKQAAVELERAVKDLKFFGGIVNDYQGAGNDGLTKLYYDTPFYDPFWKKVEQLDVPIYFHPRYPTEKEVDMDDYAYGSRMHLLGAGVQFHLDLSFHIYAMCSSGIFDRFPDVKIVVGHLGENIPFNLWRASHWYNKPSKKIARPSKHDYKYYFANNVFITTSGNFSTPGLKFCIEELGVGRCLFSIDSPYDQIEEAQAWWRTVDLDDSQKEQIGRKNAIRLFKLPLEI
ncbi:2,3-dihydroxybenzoate decarboxylase [Penicillium rolfsii]|nr:2,3-dihydroxybenzoate decarboxylase [Penicillium rolfsii]